MTPIFVTHTMPFESKLLDELENLDDDHYHRKAFEEDPKLAYKASLTLVMAHVADFHTYILDCIARRYGHTREELVDVIRSAPGWNSMYIHPVLKEFTEYQPLSSRNDIIEEEEKEAPVDESLPKVRRRKLKVPLAEPPTQEEQPTPVKKIVRKPAPIAVEEPPKVIKKKKQVQKKAETSTE